MSTPTNPKAKGKGCFVLVAVSVAAGVIGLVILSIVDRSDDVEKTAVISGGPAPCAAEESDEAEIVSAIQRGDTAASIGLQARKDIIILERGMVVQRYFLDEGMARVRVQEGYYVGKFCWVPDSVLRFAGR